MDSQPQSVTKTLQNLFEEFIYECRYSIRRRPETIRGYRAAFDLFNKLIPSLTADSLTPFALAHFCERLQNRARIVGNGEVRQGVKDSTIAAYQLKLTTFFSWLVRNGHLDRNPLDAMPRIVPKYENVKMLRKADVERIRAAIETYSHNLFQLKRDRAMVSVLLFCGLRRGELLGLRVTDVDMEKQILMVRSEASKSKLPRKLPLNGQLLRTLEDYLGERSRKRYYTTPCLFVSLKRDRGLSNQGIVQWVLRLRRLSGVRFHLHQFRHTFASNLAARGINSVQLQKLMGHTDLRMLEAYVRSIDVEDLRSTVSALTFENLA